MDWTRCRASLRTLGFVFLGAALLGANCNKKAPEYGQELLDNPGFESGTFAPWVVEQGLCEVHDTGSPWGQPAGGSYFLYGGDDPGVSTCRIRQRIDLVQHGFRPGIVDGSDLEVDAFSYLRAWQNPGNFDDQAFLRVRYLDVFEGELSSLRTLIGDDNDWILRTAEGLLPPLTRFIDVEIEASFRHGADNDGMADEASLVIDLTTPSTPSLTKLPMLQDFRQDAMTLLFETDGNLARPAVEWGPAGGALTNEVTRVETTQVDATHFVHEATITGLAAETEYDYRVRLGATTFGVYRFRTAPLATSPYRVAWISDNQNGPGTFTNHAGNIAGRSPDLVMVPGDTVQNGNVLSEWSDYWWTPLSNANLAQNVPILWARGNHDGEHAFAYAYSALPDNETFYSFTYGNAFVVVLDTEAVIGTESPEADQLAFLQSQLDSPEALAAEWRIVTFHRPPYTNLWDATNFFHCLGFGGGYVGEDWVRNNWVSVFEQKNVDLVIAGHTHSYQRGTQNGVTYVMVGGGGGALDTFCAGEWPFLVQSLSEFHYNLMDVDGNVLDWTARDQNDTIIDTFQLVH